MDFDAPGFILAILWTAFAFSFFANIVLIRKKFFPPRKKGENKGTIKH